MSVTIISVLVTGGRPDTVHSTQYTVHSTPPTLVGKFPSRDVGVPFSLSE